MKKLIFSLALCLVSVFGFGQNNAIEKYFGEYLQSEDFTKVSVSQRMFDLFTELDVNNEEEKAVLDAISKLDGIKAIFNDDLDNPIALFQSSMAKVSKDSFEELMSIDDSEGKVHVMIQEEGDKIVELLLLAAEDNGFMALSLFGEIDLKAISRLANVMDIRGLDKLKNIEE